jgi:hypothetical protein
MTGRVLASLAGLAVDCPPPQTVSAPCRETGRLPPRSAEARP